MSEFPLHWTTTSLGVICGKGQYGWTTKATGQGNVKFLRTTDITKRTIDWSSVPYCQEEPPDIEKYLVKPSDILISRAGSVGFSTLITSLPPPTVFASYLIRFVPCKDIAPKFVAYFLRSSDYWHQISDVTAGIALANVNAAKLADVNIPLAPLNEQQRIADKLDAVLARVDACRERLDRVSAILKRFRQFVLAAATSGKLTEEWREGKNDLNDWRDVRLADIADVQGGVTKDAKKQSLEDEEVPYLRVANVQRGYLDLDEIKTIRVPAGRLAGLLLEPGDILFNEGGDIDKLGRGWVWEGQIRRCTFQNHVFRARLYDKANQPKYISWWGNYRGLDYFLRAGKQTTNLASINKTMLSGLPISLPPADEQLEIIRRVESLFAYADRLEARYTAARAQIERLTPALLAKTFRGELVPQDPNDEPASVLLERIRAVREAAPAKPKQHNGGSRSKRALAG